MPLLSHNIVGVPKRHDTLNSGPKGPAAVGPGADFTKPQEWRLYEYITRHFIASLMPNMAYTEFRYTIALGMEQFTYTARPGDGTSVNRSTWWRYFCDGIVPI